MCDTIKKSNHWTKPNQTKQKKGSPYCFFPKCILNWFHHLFITFHFGQNSNWYFTVFINNLKYIYALYFVIAVALIAWFNTGQFNTCTYNTHRIETMEKRKIAERSEWIVRSLYLYLIGKKKPHTHTHTHTHLLSDYTLIANTIDGRLFAKKITCTLITLLFAVGSFARLLARSLTLFY